MPAPRRYSAHLAILAANIIFGVNYTVAKGVIPHYVEPLALTLIRVASAVVFLWGFGAFFPHEMPARKDFPRLILCSLFGVSINQMMFMTGLNYTTPIDAAILMVVIPIMVLVFAAWLIGERITPAKMAGIGLGATGAAMLILNRGELSFGSNQMLGNGLMLLNATSYALYLVIVKPLMTRYHPFTVLKWVFLLGLPVVLPFGIGGMGEIRWAELHNGIWLSLLFITFFTTFLSYLFNMYGLRYVNASTVSAYIYLQPGFATAIALVMGQDSLSIRKVIASAIIFTGVWLVSRRESGPKPAAFPEKADGQPGILS